MCRFGKHSTIFVPELDDDAVRILGRDTSQLALFAYLMLGRKIGIHPAYQWQHPEGRDLIHCDLDFLKCKDVHIILDDFDTTDEYIFDRIENLTGAVTLPAIDNTELQQYMRFTKDEIQRDCDVLDEYIVAEGRIVRTGWSPDERFRKLVRDELELVRQVRYGSHLGALLLNRGSHLFHAQLQGLIDRLVDVSKDMKRTFSCYSVISELVAMDYAHEGIGKINDRLHLLHWKAHGGDGIEVPLVYKLERGLVHPMDPDLFWSVSSVILGQQIVEELLRLPWPEQFRLARALQDDVDWTNYLSLYYVAVDELSRESQTLDADKVRRHLNQAYSSTARAVLKGIPKWEVAVLSSWLGAVYGVSSIPVPGIVGTVVKVASVIVLGGIVSPLPKIRKFGTAIVKSIRESATCDRKQLAKSLQERLSKLRFQQSHTEETH